VNILIKNAVDSSPELKKWYEEKGIEMVEVEKNRTSVWLKAHNTTMNGVKFKKGHVMLLNRYPARIRKEMERGDVPFMNMIKRKNKWPIVCTAVDAPTTTVKLGKTRGEEGLVDLEEIIQDLDRNRKLEDLVKINPNLSPKDRKRVLDIIFEHADVFAVLPHELGTMPDYEYNLKLEEGAKPFHTNAYPVPEMEERKMQAAVESLEKLGVIRKSISPWSSPAIIVKKEGKPDRLCIDYRRLNKMLVSDSFPMPRIDAILTRLKNKGYYSAFDAKKGYYQVKMNPEHQERSAFSIPSGLYEFLVMPFGFKTAPAMFQRIANELVDALREFGVTVYLDDILLPSENLEEHLLGIRAVLQAVRAKGLKLHPEKCEFCFFRLDHLGHTISLEGIETNERKIKAMSQLPPPTSKKEVRQLMGMFQYYGKFMPNLNRIASPLFDLLQKKRKEFLWRDEQHQAFKELKMLLVSPPVLAHFDWEAEHELATDASEIGIGAVLWQLKEGKKNPVLYLSKRFSGAQANWPITEKEGFAIIWAIKKLEPLLYGKHFTVKTDHAALRELFHGKNIKSKVARWAMSIAEFDFNVIYEKAEDNLVADWLSRHPPEALDPIENFAYLMMVGTEGWNQASSGGRSFVCTFMSPNIKKLQLEDPFCSRAIQWLTVFQSDPVKNMGEFQGLEMNEKNQLVRLMPEYLGRRRRNLVLPICLTNEVLKETHSAPGGGHGGVLRTMMRIIAKYWWPRMIRHVTEFVKSCPECQKNKNPTICPAGLMQISTTPDSPFDHWALDIVGPYTEKDENNVGRKKYIIVMVDLFSRWTVAKTVKDYTAKTVAKFIQKHIFLKFGLPQSILTDQGATFMSDEMAVLCERAGVLHFSTTSYHQQANAKVERVNKMIGETIRCYVNNKGNEWPLHLGHIILALNTSFCTPIQMTPYMAVFGKEARMKMDNLLDWSASFLERVEYRDQDDLHYRYLLRCFAWSKMEVQKWDNKVRYDKKRRNVTYERGDLVLRMKEGNDPKVTKKLVPKYEGPYIVQRRTTAVNYDILRCRSDGPPVNVHVSKLKPWNVRVRKKHTELPVAQVSIPAEVQEGTEPTLEVPIRVPNEEGSEFSVETSVSSRSGEAVEDVFQPLKSNSGSGSSHVDPNYDQNTELDDLSTETASEKGSTSRSKKRSLSESDSSSEGIPMRVLRPRIGSQAQVALQQ
jgi:hypothetical protein